MHTHRLPQPRHIDRESARESLTAKLESQLKFQAAMEAEAHLPHCMRKTFASIDPKVIIADTRHRLRWIDCAPEGANHQVAFMQDKTGTPCGSAFNENVGPNLEVRQAGEKYGGWKRMKTIKHLAAQIKAETGCDHHTAYNQATAAYEA